MLCAFYFRVVFVFLLSLQMHTFQREVLFHIGVKVKGNNTGVNIVWQQSVLDMRGSNKMQGKTAQQRASEFILFIEFFFCTMVQQP